MSWPRAARVADAWRSSPRGRGQRLWRPSARLGLDALLGRKQPELFQPLDLGARERLVGDVGQCSAPPESEAGLERLDGRRRLVRGVRTSPFLEQAARSSERRSRPARPATRSRRQSSPASSSGPSAFRRREICTSRLWAAVPGGRSLHSSSIRRSRETTSFACTRKSASTARCLAPPIGTDRPSRTASSGPSSRNSNLPPLTAAAEASSRLRASREQFERQP